MRMSQAEMQADYDERKQRCNDGVGSDEDRNHVKRYERDGFIESRLLREQLAKQSAREQYARERASVGEDDDEDDDGPDDGRLTERSKVARWREFAVNINEQLGEDAPIEDVTKATKRELIAAYGNYAQQSTQE
jgi:hypothetical protein